MNDISDGRLFSESEPGRKGEILAAALTVFSERGYESGSMRSIADRVGVTEPALYRHFANKEAIFLALMRLGAGRLQGEIVALIGTLRPDGLRDQMLAAMSERRRALRFYAPLIRVILPAAAREERLLAEYRATIIEPLRAAITAKAAEMDAAFGVRDADATRASRVRALLSLLVGFIASSYVLQDEPDEAVVDAALRMMGWEAALG